MSVQDFILGVRGAATTTNVASVVMIAVIVTAVAFLVVLLVYFVHSRSPRGRVDALLDARAESHSESRWAVRLVAVALFALGIFAANYAIDRPSTCASCHSEPDYAASLAESPHSDLSCMGCHGGTGAGRALRTATIYTRWAVVYAASQEPPEPTGSAVSDLACLRCHANVRSGTSVARGIRVRHSDFLDTGARCRDCHNSVAHGEMVFEPTDPGMDDCVPCHDGDKASSECDVCHVADELQMATQTAKLPKVHTVDSSDCYACHEEAPCLECHGITMPHPDDWAPNEDGPGLSGSHAREGFTDRELCWRCHYSNGQPFVRPASRGGFLETPDGCTCHGSFGTMHGGEAWVAEHGLQATGQKAGAEAECYFCHDARYLCDGCHEPSIKERYNPRSGPDNYVRDIPRPDDYWEY